MSLCIDRYGNVCQTFGAMIDPSRLQENDLFVLSVVRHGHSCVLTLNVKRREQFLLRSPQLVRDPVDLCSDERRLATLINALPPLNRLPQGLTLQAERAVCGEHPVAPVYSASPSDPVDRLNAWLHIRAMEPAKVPEMWQGFTRVEVRVVRGDEKPLEPRSLGRRLFFKRDLCARPPYHAVIL